MDQFLTGLVVGAGAIIFLGMPEPKIVEVLPENYDVITDISESICQGPFDSEYVGRTVRTQRVQYTGN
jgi:hypothetical protein